MGSLCFSSAAILRCVSLDRLQNSLLVIPPALEVIFTTSLIFINWNAGRQYLLLTVEGWLYLALAIIDVLSHVLPAAREDMNVFRAFDLAIGIASFLPILFYALFLYFFTRSELLYTLPRRIQKIAKLLLLAFIPAIIVMHIVASFVGVQILTVNTTILIGFPTHTAYLLWTFFTSLTLALLTSFQALVFCLAFYRLIYALLSQRRIESTAADAAHFVNGLGWINAALKLGAVETVVGFAGGSFGVVFTRRIMRFLSRALLSIGLAKGIDAMEDFRAVRNEMAHASRQRNARGSTLRAFISNPRFSTFQQLTPTASSFYAAQQGQGQGKFTQLQDPSEKAGEKTQTQNQQRVTVHYDHGAPTLHMRFSDLGLPDPALPVSEERGRNTLTPPKAARLSPGTPAGSDRNSSSYSPSIMADAEIITAPQRTLSQKSAMALMLQTTGNSVQPTTPVTVRSLPINPRPRLTSAPRPRLPSSLDTRPSAPDMTRPRQPSADTLLVVQELAPQFPGTPRTARSNHLESGWDDDESIPPSAASSEGFPPRLTRDQKGKGVVRGGEEVEEEYAPEDGQGDFERDQRLSVAEDTMLPLTPPPPALPADPTETYRIRGGGMRDSEPEPDLARLLIARSNRDTFGPSRHTSATDTLSLVSSPSPLGIYTTNLTTLYGSTQTVPTSAVTPDGDGEDPFLDFGTAMDARQREWKAHREQAQAQAQQQQRTPMSTSTAQRTPMSTSTRGSTDALTIPWLQNPEIEAEERRLAHAISRPSQPTPLSRIKSIGAAPRRATPTPTRAKAPRGSTHLERLVIPPPARNSRATEIIQGGVPSVYSPGSGVLRDSEVLGIEDGSIVREIKRTYQ